MHCHLLIPGLLPPDRNFRAALTGVPLPALSLMLGKGQVRLAAGQSAEDWLRWRFDLAGAAVAPLRRLGEEAPPTVEGDWLCADPVHLHFTSQGLMLADAEGLAIRLEEAATLVAGLNQEFGNLGAFSAPTPTRWYLQAAAAVHAHFHPLGETVGRRADRFLPEGPEASLWRRHFNDIQVFLHGHPVNQARQAAGQPAINSIWFWGHGTLPAGPTSAPCSAVLADTPLARGLARLCDLPCHDAGEFLHQRPTAGGDILAVRDAARAPALQEDHQAWTAALAELDGTWLAPALAALKSGRFKTLSLTAPGDRATLEIRLTRSDLWKFWRRPELLQAVIHTESG